MNEKSFVLLSLKDNAARKVTQALNNDTSLKILDYLANNESATETELSKTLKIPMSTVHYNVKMLCEGKLLESDDYNYSSKGKEVIHYKLANKYIIIAPKEDKTFMDKLKNFIPGIVGVGLVSLGIGLTQNFSKIKNVFIQPNLMSAMTEKSMDVAGDTMLFAVESYQDVAPVADSLNTSGALWFLFGGMFVLLLMMTWDFAKEQKTQKKVNNKKK